MPVLHFRYSRDVGVLHFRWRAAHVQLGVAGHASVHARQVFAVDDELLDEGRKRSDLETFVQRVVAVLVTRENHLVLF